VSLSGIDLFILTSFLAGILFLGTFFRKPVNTSKDYFLAKKMLLWWVHDTWQEFGMHLGIALSHALNILGPGIIIIGGSLSNAYDLFSQVMKETLMAHINPVHRERIKLVKAKLGDKAGFIGAACLVMENLRLKDA